MIEVRHLTAGYERHPALHHVSLQWQYGDRVAIVGPNGAGKSTLLKTLMGLVRPMEGSVSGLQGKRVAYLPQATGVDRSFPVTVEEMVILGLWQELGALGWRRAAHRQRCHEALATVGLQGFERRTLDTLSGGQFQRALFARLMLQDAEVVLLDEPFAAVDSRTTHDLLHVMHGWHAEGRTVIAVLHDMELVRTEFPTTTLLARELVASGPTAQVLTPGNLLRARGLQEAFDDRAPVCGPHEEPPAGPGHGHEAHSHQGHSHSAREVVAS
jgi:zinc/manganese transport system ATP-binding protein